MENTNNKVITVSFMVAAILAGIVVSVLMETLAAVTVGAAGRFFAQEFVRHGLPVASGLVLFFVLQFNKSVTLWADEVVTEIRRVVWPSRKETSSMTVVVCVMLLASGLAFGLLDALSGWTIDWLLQKNLLGIFG
jgi:preprotein translocase subunit SecE